MSGMILSSRFFSLSFRTSFFFFMRWICNGSQPVQDQLLLLHALDLQRIAAGGDHRGDGGIEIRVFLFQPCKLETNFGLFLIRHVYRL